MLSAGLFTPVTTCMSVLTQDGGEPPQDGGGPDSTPDNTRGAEEMDRLSTPVLAGTVHHSQTDIDL